MNEKENILCSLYVGARAQQYVTLMCHLGKVLYLDRNVSELLCTLFLLLKSSLGFVSHH